MVIKLVVSDAFVCYMFTQGWSIEIDNVVPYPVPISMTSAWEWSNALVTDFCLVINLYLYLFPGEAVPLWVLQDIQPQIVLPSPAQFSCYSRTCTTCGKEFRDPHSFRSHARGCGKITLACPSCPHTTSHMGNLNRHTKKHAWMNK